jgi:hypothetical protein
MLFNRGESPFDPANAYRKAKKDILCIEVSGSAAGGFWARRERLQPAKEVDSGASDNQCVLKPSHRPRISFSHTTAFLRCGKRAQSESETKQSGSGNKENGE